MERRLKSTAILIPVALVLWGLSAHPFFEKGPVDLMRVLAVGLFLVVGSSAANQMLIQAGKARDTASRLGKLAMAAAGLLLIPLSASPAGADFRNPAAWALAAVFPLLAAWWGWKRWRLAVRILPPANGV